MRSPVSRASEFGGIALGDMMAPQLFEEMVRLTENLTRSTWRSEEGRARCTNKC